MQKFNIFPTLICAESSFLNKEDLKTLKKAIKNQEGLNSHIGLKHDNYSKTSYITSYDGKFHKFLDKPELKNIKNKILKKTAEYIKESGMECTNEMRNSWFNIQFKGGALGEHTHPFSMVSGALYINVDDKSSPLVFHNPNPCIYYISHLDHTKESAYEWFQLDPKIGDLVIFPSWLKHGSNQIQNGTKGRTVISFNIT